MDQFSSKLTTSSAFLHTKVLSTEGSRPPSASFSLCGLISPDNDFLFCVLEKSAHTCNLNTPFNHCFFFPWAHLVLILQPCPALGHVCAQTPHGNFTALVIAARFSKPLERHGATTPSSCSACLTAEPLPETLLHFKESPRRARRGEAHKGLSSIPHYCCLRWMSLSSGHHVGNRSLRYNMKPRQCCNIKIKI